VKLQKPTAVVIAGTALLALVLSGCSASPKTAITNDPKAVVTVWTDATRQAGFEQFQKSHPNIKLKITPVLTGSDLFTKLQLFNRTGSGWPDVIFDANTVDIATLADKQINFAEPLTTKLTSVEKQGFGTSNDICTVNGVLSCLRNDVAPTNLWYNKTLMSQFGYDVPKTWAEYAALGAKVVKEHPGYYVGAAGDSGFLLYNAFQSVGCPLTDVTGPNTVHIDTTNSKCTTVASLLDGMLANGSLLKSGTFDPATIKVAQAGQLLMDPGANWYGAYVFQPAAQYNFPQGSLAAAPPLALGSAKPYSGSQGGGTYVVSRHAKNMDGAVAVAKWMATNVEYQKTAPTYPAYKPAASVWSTAVASSPFYAENPVPTLKAQVSLVNPVNNFATRYDPAAAFTNILVAAIRSNTSLQSALPALQTQLVNEAKAQGYTVK
jgi:ABC-type glycerol-3-phosphate transport system substrate-binding protein